MGNTHSTEVSPNASPKDAHGPVKRPPKRKESIGGLAAKGAAVPPTASLESAAGQPRGRSSTIPTNQKKPLDKPGPHSLPNANVDAAVTSERSRSPRPPLNVDTSSPAPIDTEPLPRNISANQSANSESPTSAMPYQPFSHFGRPPRLPLPIEEEPHAPGSPAPGSPELLAHAADEIKSDIEPLDRNQSVLSATTLDEDDEDDEDVRYTADDVQGPLVDTLLEWKEGGDKVYVTGTFCDWAKKSRLHKNGPNKDPDTFSAIIALPPGALYLSFLVDGVAKTARHMPTTVDWTNALVNYLHVPPEDAPQPILVADNSLLEKSGQVSADIIPPVFPEVRPASKEEITGATVPTQEPKQLPPRSSASAQAPRKHKHKQSAATEAEERRRRLEAKQKAPDKKKYHTDIPSYLLDWDAPENSSRVRRANAVSDTHQPPPQLPAYLAKSILSAVTPLKDDASVLMLPNHTVLNHLATSSIKDGVLGTSATTRYKKKFVTTIMYMPTGLN